MVLRNSAERQSVLEDQFERRLFNRRTDLANAIRLAIATSALYAKTNGVWGTMTDLANRYQVSRPFVYSLADDLKEVGQFLFSESSEVVYASFHRELAIQIMLSLRLEARSSIGAISTVIHLFEHDLSATGSISQVLSRIGKLLPMTISNETGIIQYLVFASGKIFSQTIPILVTVDPRSGAILRIELTGSRKAEDWKNHSECLYDNGVKAIYLVSDEGKGTCAGHTAMMSDVVRQTDTYHAIAHNLGSWPDRLEKAAYKAIGVEDECKRKLVSAKSDQVKEKREAEYEKSAEAVKKQ